MTHTYPVEPDPQDLTPAQNFFRQCEAGQHLFEAKNAPDHYDNNFVRDGLLGTVLEVMGSANRLRPLIVKAPDHGRANAEKIRDILMDVHNYATMSLMLLEANNWEGE